MIVGVMTQCWVTNKHFISCATHCNLLTITRYQGVITGCYVSKEDYTDFGIVFFFYFKRYLNLLHLRCHTRQSNLLECGHKYLHELILRYEAL